LNPRRVLFLSNTENAQGSEYHLWARQRPNDFNEGLLFLADVRIAVSGVVFSIV